MGPATEYFSTFSSSDSNISLNKSLPYPRVILQSWNGSYRTKLEITWTCFKHPILYPDAGKFRARLSKHLTLILSPTILFNDIAQLLFPPKAYSPMSMTMAEQLCGIPQMNLPYSVICCEYILITEACHGALMSQSCKFYTQRAQQSYPNFNQWQLHYMDLG